MRVWAVGLFLFSALDLRAEEAPAAVEPAPAVTQVPPVAAPTTTVRRVREKEADGSEAINRFKTDAVIKSQYKLNGQSLEVDPD